MFEFVMIKDAATRANCDIDYIEFDSSRSFAHKFIYKAEELPHLVSKFVSKCQKFAS